MFQILINQMQAGCQEMERQMWELHMISEELERVIKNMHTLSRMEESEERLKKQRNAFLEEEYGLQQMINALDRSLSTYVCCEKRIINKY